MAEKIKVTDLKVRPNKVLKAVVLIVASGLIFGYFGYWFGVERVPDSATTSTATVPTTASATTSISSTSSPTTSASATFNFDTPSIINSGIYKNGPFGFTFSLSDNYITLEGGSCEGACSVNIRIGKKSSDQISQNTGMTIQYMDMKSNPYTLQQAIDSYTYNNGDIIKTSDLTIDGASAKKYYLGGMESGYHIIAVKDNKEFQIDVYPEASNNVDLMNNIVDSFKF